jgi:L-threonylcarbamoyladenylate synthase
MKTRIVKVGTTQLGAFRDPPGPTHLDSWSVDGASGSDLASLTEAAQYLREKDTPVAFPTETVYGLGADAQRSAAVKGIYAAKGRPSDNPLIVHVCDLDMLRGLLVPGKEEQGRGSEDPIPDIYKPLIERFWPGPLTILLPSPTPSKLAPEVTAGLPNFGARMPSSALARSLIKLADAPLAAPSANASTKPSPTTAQHVLEDLDGRIELILDGGSCQVGVESTVVDGLCNPPVVLRPGGVSLQELRECPGWEGAAKAYKDHSEEGKATPRAPGMKYKHYSPKAKVVLYESSFSEGSKGVVEADRENVPVANGVATSTEVNGNSARGTSGRRVGIIRTRRWGAGGGFKHEHLVPSTGTSQVVSETNGVEEQSYVVEEGDLVDDEGRTVGRILDINLGKDIRRIAQGLFSALRELDRRGADIIFVDGIEDDIDIAGAVMNRLRKAATDIRA